VGSAHHIPIQFSEESLGAKKPDFWAGVQLNCIAPYLGFGGQCPPYVYFKNQIKSGIN